MQKCLTVVSALFLLISCQDINRTPKPEDLIPEDKMVDVLTEISLLHGARSYNRGLMEEKGIDPYIYLNRKFGIDSTQLVASNNYYSQNYKQYSRIYDSVKVRLEFLVEEFDSLRELEKKRRDSLRKLNTKDALVPTRLKRDSLLPSDLRLDSLMPLKREKNLPAPVSKEKF